MTNLVTGGIASPGSVQYSLQYPHTLATVRHSTIIRSRLCVKYYPIGWLNLKLDRTLTFMIEPLIKNSNKRTSFVGLVTPSVGNFIGCCLNSSSFISINKQRKELCVILQADEETPRLAKGSCHG